MTPPRLRVGQVPDSAVALVASPTGWAYRGRAGCRDVRCTQDGNPDRCYGWHCCYCNGPSNSQADCTNPECPGPDAGAA